MKVKGTIFIGLLFLVLSNSVNGDTIKVTGKVINKVKPLLFGDNVEWWNNGMHLYDPDSDTFAQEAIDLIKDIGVTHLRYPGGCLSDMFNWSEAIGPFKKRVKQQCPVYWKEGKQLPRFGPHEFARLCKALNCKQTITLNAGVKSGTPVMAANWVKYCKDKGYDVVHFCIGNEVYMDFPPPEGQTPERYRDYWLKCYDAIQKAVPGTPVGAVGAVWNKYPNWLDVVIPAIKDKVAFLDTHNAYFPAMRNMENESRVTDEKFAKGFAAASIITEKNLIALYGKMKKLAGPYWDKMEITISESGPLLLLTKNKDDYKWNNTIIAGLYQATLFNLFAKDPKISSVNHMPLYPVDFYPSLVAAAKWDKGKPQKHTLYKTVLFHVFKMYCEMANREVIETEVECGTYDISKINAVSLDLSDVPFLDVVAFRQKRPDKELTIFVVNRDLHNDHVVNIYPGYDSFKITSLTVITSASYMDGNTKKEQDKVKPKEYISSPRSYKNKCAVLRISKHSIARIKIMP
jgi:alpha-L-arabinofuranosidase